MNFIGIDPGKNGGIAVLAESGKVLVAEKMPDTDQTILSLLRPFAQTSDTKALVERVRSSPQMGVVSAFSFGQGYGGLRMALAALFIPFDEVIPRKWQPVMGVFYHKGDGEKKKPRDKNVAKQRAMDLFPDMKVTHAIADALLIAEYARRTLK